MRNIGVNLVMRWSLDDNGEGLAGDPASRLSINLTQVNTINNNSIRQSECSYNSLYGNVTLDDCESRKWLEGLSQCRMLKQVLHWNVSIDELPEQSPALT